MQLRDVCWLTLIFAAVVVVVAKAAGAPPSWGLVLCELAACAVYLALCRLCWGYLTRAEE